MEKTTKNKSTKKIVLNVVEWVLIVLAVIFVAFVAIFASKKPTNNSSASLFGYETRLVVSGSMEADDSFYKDKNYEIKCIKTGSLVFLSSAPASTEKLTSDKKYTAKLTDFANSINVGDVVTFVPESGTVNAITHRVTNKYAVGNKIRFETRGDVATSKGETAVESFYAENIEGKVVGTSAFLGKLYTNVFSNKPVMLTIILVPTLGIIGYEIYKIVTIVKEDKKLKVQVAQVSKTKDDEIKELEEKLAKLKEKQADSEKKEEEK